MYVWPVIFENFNGIEVTVDHYFNLSKTELTKMQVGTEGGLNELLQKIVKAKDAKAIMNTIDEIIMKAYGVKSDDGMYLIKNDDVREKFKCSPAYDVVFYELVTDDEKAADFIKKILPKDLVTKAMENPETAALLSGKK